MNKQCQIQYYPKSRKVKIDANSTDFYPAYVKYLFEYLRIPTNATIIFKDRTIKGIETWLKESK